MAKQDEKIILKLLALPLKDQSKHSKKRMKKREKRSWNIEVRNLISHSTKPPKWRRNCQFDWVNNYSQGLDLCGSADCSVKSMISEDYPSKAKSAVGFELFAMKELNETGSLKFSEGIKVEVMWFKFCNTYAFKISPQWNKTMIRACFFSLMLDYYKIKLKHVCIQKVRLSKSFNIISQL